MTPKKLVNHPKTIPYMSWGYPFWSYSAVVKVVFLFLCRSSLELCSSNSKRLNCFYVNAEVDPISCCWLLVALRSVFKTSWARANLELSTNLRSKNSCLTRSKLLPRPGCLRKPVLVFKTSWARANLELSTNLWSKNSYLTRSKLLPRPGCLRKPVLVFKTS